MASTLALRAVCIIQIKERFPTLARLQLLCNGDRLCIRSAYHGRRCPMCPVFGCADLRKNVFSRESLTARELGKVDLLLVK